jgi:hypothetical protein
MAEQTQSYEVGGDKYKITLRYSKIGELTGSEFTVRASSLEELNERIRECDEIIARKM